MKVFLFLLLIGVNAFAGWFTVEGSEIVEKEGNKISIMPQKDLGEDGYRFRDFDWSNWIYNKDYYEKMSHRMDVVFSEIEAFGKKKGYKSFIFVNEKISFYEGFPINDLEQLREYCMVQGLEDKKTYKSLCSGNADTLLGKSKNDITAKVVYYKENNPNFFPIR